METIKNTIIYLISLIVVSLVFSAEAKQGAVSAGRDSGESQECYNQRVATLYTGKNHRTQSCINREKIGDQFSFLFKMLGFGFIGFIGFTVVLFLFKEYERRVLEEFEKEPDFKKEFEYKFKEYDVFHKDLIRKSTVIDNMLKIDLVDYAKNEGALVNSKDSKKDIIESVLKLKLNKELKSDLVRYCNLIGVYIFSRDTKEQVIDKLIEFKKQNIKG